LLGAFNQAAVAGRAGLLGLYEKDEYQLGGCMNNGICAAHIQIRISLSSIGAKNLITELRFLKRKNPIQRTKSASIPRSR